MPQNNETLTTPKHAAGQRSIWALQAMKTLHETASLVGCELAPGQLEGYLRLLAEIPSEKIAEACDRWLRESSYMPRPADILRLCGKGPDAMAAKAWAELLAWIGEWGVDGVKRGEPEFKMAQEGPYMVLTRVPHSHFAPPLPPRTTRAIIALTGTHAASMQRIKGAMDDPERLARVQSDFVKAWKGAL